MRKLVLHLAHQFCTRCSDGNDADNVAQPPPPPDLETVAGRGDDTSCSNFSIIGFAVLYPPFAKSGSGGGDGSGACRD